MEYPPPYAEMMVPANSSGCLGRPTPSCDFFIRSDTVKLDMEWIKAIQEDGSDFDRICPGVSCA